MSNFIKTGIFLGLWVLSALSAHAAPHACKGCTNARRAYVNAVLFDLCFGTSSLLGQLTSLKDLKDQSQTQLVRLTGQYEALGCPNATRTCRNLLRRINRKQSEIYAIEGRLLRLYEQVKRECNRSRRDEARNQCDELESPQYCDPVDAAGSDEDKIMSAYLAVLKRCDDLKEERRNWRANCRNPTSTPIPTSTSEPPSFVGTAEPTATPAVSTPVDTPTPSPQPPATDTPLPPPTETALPPPTETPGPPQTATPLPTTSPPPAGL